MEIPFLRPSSQTPTGFRNVTPYAFAELRINLNDPACKAQWNGTEYTSYEFGGYSDVNLTRIRGALGAEWKLTRQHSLDFTLMLDYIRSKEIDTNKSGTKIQVRFLGFSGFYAYFSENIFA